MKKLLFYSILFLSSMILNGCTPSVNVSHYLYLGDSYDSSGMRIELSDIQVDEDIVTFEIEYIKYKEVLPDFEITDIIFTFQNNGYDYMQRDEFAHEDIYTSTINGNNENLDTYSFNVNETYIIVLSVDFGYFLDDYDPMGITSGIDTNSVVVYMEVATVYIRLSTKA